jgi:diguanylate cyclase (GGDEF)-like protein/PAS domain S-box-containing protein
MPTTDQSAKMLTMGSPAVRPNREDGLWRLIALVSDLYWEEDDQGRCLSLQCADTAENWQRFSGLPGKDLQSHGFRSVSDAALAGHIAIRQARQSFNEYICVCETAVGLCYLSVSGEPQFADDGSFLGYHCLARDITRQRLDESSLHRFRAAMDMSNDMIYLVDRETMRFIDVNDTACINAGYTREQLLSMGPAELIEGTEEQIAARYDRMISEGIPSRIENVARTVQGEKAIVEVHSRALQVDGRWIIIGMTRDVTERKRAEQTSIRLQQMFSALSESNEAILRATSVESLYQNVCRAAIKGGKFIIASIMGPTSRGWLRSIVTEGTVTPITEGVRVSVDPALPEGQGVAGVAFRTRQPCICNDFQHDPRTAPWHELGRIQTIQSAAAFPLFKRRHCVAVLIFYASELNAFDAEIVKLLEGMAENVSYALDSFEGEAERKQAEAVLRESEERFRSLTHLSSDFYWEQDLEFRFTKYEGKIAGEANKQAVADLIGKHLWDIENVLPESMSWDVLKRALKMHARLRDYEFSFCNRDGNTYHFALAGEPRFDAEGNFVGYRGIVRDITDRKRISDHIKYLATHDHLTGLPNRVMFSELLEQSSKTATRYKDQAFAILFIDLDRFKSVNDTYGHHVGDALLREVSRRLRKPLRASDVVARLGGDEFVILLQNISGQEQIEKVANNLLAALTGSILLSGKECRITASIGISIFGVDAFDEETLMKHADAAMYIAKDEGKNNFQFYSQDIHIRTQERINLELHLRDALDRQEFMLHYQAKLDLVTGRITGVEALLRWNNSVLGHITPDRFIPVAEETGHILPIGNWVLLCACQQVAHWIHQGLGPLSLAVNLSARQFNDPDLLDHIRHALEFSGLPAHCLELEITESVVISNPERAFRLMSQIKALGVALALDDFGTGYSSLGQLKNYPIDTLKVDRTFIREVPDNAQDNAITKAIISMGNTLGLRIVAEGVETSAQLEFLRLHNCQTIQGFYFHRPCSAEEFGHWYRQHSPASFARHAGDQTSVEHR